MLDPLAKLLNLSPDVSIKLVTKTYILLFLSSVKIPIILASQSLDKSKSVIFKLPNEVETVPTSEPSD